MIENSYKQAINVEYLSEKSGGEGYHLVAGVWIDTFWTATGRPLAICIERGEPKANVSVVNMHQMNVLWDLTV